MPTITVPTEKLIIPLDGFATVQYGSSSQAIAANNAGVAWYYVPPETFTITSIIFNFTVGTGPSPNTFDVGIQGVDATTGKPNGTFVSSGVWTCPASGGGFATVTVSSFSMVKGTAYYVVVRNAISGYSGNVTINVNCSSNQSGSVFGAHTRTSGVWSGATTRPGGNFWLYSGTKYYGPSCYTLSASETARTGSDEIGTTIQLPAGHPTLTLTGVIFNLASFNVETYTVRVRNAAGTILASNASDGDFNTNQNVPYWELNTTVDLVAGTKYYILLCETPDAGDVPLMRTCTNLNAALMTDVRNGIVANMVVYNGTTYTETTTKTCQGYLMFNGIKYDQTGGTTVASLPAGFNQLDF
jgi:hypothetical protein